MITVPVTPTVHRVPAARPKPVGRVEWAVTPTRLYGVDRTGQVWVFDAPALPDPRTPRSALRRLLAAVLG